jgi:Tol biopolymer transport system component
MTNDDLELRLARRLREQAPEPSWDFADRVMSATDSVPQDRRGLSSLLPSRMPGSVPAPLERGFNRRAVVLLMAAALLVGLMAGAIAVGAGLVKLPSVLPSPPLVTDTSAQPSASTSPDSGPSASPEPTPAEPLALVAYVVREEVEPQPEECSSAFHPWCHETRIWVANADGTDAHELLPGVPGNQTVVAWMPDGSRLLYAEDRGLALTDLSGSEQEIITATQCPEGTVTNCPNLGGSLSPDGSRLAYTLLEGSQADTSVVAIFDLATRQITLLEATRTTGVDQGCATAAGQGDNGTPLWSPDGTRLVVTRSNIGPLDDRGNCRSIVYTINADGSGFQVVVPSGARRQPSSAGWSPDGSHLVLSSINNDPQGGSDWTCNIAIVRPDGSELRQLTNDGISCGPRWTRDGRILFDRWTDLEAETYDLWSMDADGTNPARLPDRSITTLTAIGCVACPVPSITEWSEVLWQPIP